MSWFRFHDDAMNDPKVQNLPPELFRTWVNLLCVASKNSLSTGGELNFNVFDLSFMLRMSRTRMAVQLQHLVDAGLLDKTENGWKPHNWSKWQFKSDSSTQRSQRCRERKRNVAATSPDTDTDQSTDTDTEIATLRVADARKRLQADFDLWYETYPRKKARPDALTKYKTARKKADAATLLAGAERERRQHEERNEIEFVPHPATWLHQERWLDVEEKPSKPKDKEQRKIDEIMKGVL